MVEVLTMFHKCVVFMITSISVIHCLPDCYNNLELDRFLKSDRYLSQYTAFSSIKAKINRNNDLEDYWNDSNIHLKDVLPEDNSTYLTRTPPKFCNEKTPKVIFHVTVVSLDTIDESSMTYVLDLWLTMIWYDDRLRYPNSSNSIPPFRYVDMNWITSLWMPDVVFKNARKVKFHDVPMKNAYLILTEEKQLVYCTKLTLTLTCLMRLKLYPHDTQNCSLEFESMKYLTQDLEFKWDEKTPVTIQRKISTPQYSIEGDPEIGHCKNTYVTGKYSCIKATFKLKRRFGYHLLHFYIPASLVVFISWMTFWINARDLTARFGLGLTCLLTLVTLNSQSVEGLPPVSYNKAIDIWMMSCISFVFVSIIIYTFINYIIGKYPKDRENEAIFHLGIMKLKRTNHQMQIFAFNIDRISRIFFPSGYIIFNFWYWRTFVSCDSDSSS